MTLDMTGNGHMDSHAVESAISAGAALFAPVPRAQTPLGSADGLHLTGDLRNCQVSRELLCDASALDQLLTRAALRSNLTIVGRAFHTFEPSGVTGCLLLAESHISIHTWPELRYVSLDVYVCNHERDNNDHARTLFRYLASQLKCADAQPSEWRRGAVGA